MKLKLITTLPAHMLKMCEKVIARPSWEGSLQWSSAFLLFVLMCVLAMAILEADRILRTTLADLSRGPPLIAPLDFRLLSSSSPNATSGFADWSQLDRSSTLLAKMATKEPAVPVCNSDCTRYSPNAKKTGKAKLPEAEMEEERNLRLRHVEEDNAVSNGLGTKKKNGKRVNSEANSCPPENNHEPSKPVGSNVTKKVASPALNRKSKSVDAAKEDCKSVNTKDAKEAEAKTQVTKNAKSPNNRKKQSLGTTSQKVGTLYSEEESSSTTTESSAQEDAVATTPVTATSSSNKAVGVMNKLKVRFYFHWSGSV